jgi:predicted RNA polymerase sigma factor
MSEPVTSERSPEQIRDQIRELLGSLYREDSGRILATLIRLLGDFDLAEEAMHEAFAAALSLWPSSGVPGNPRPWLISTARFKGVDVRDLMLLKTSSRTISKRNGVRRKHLKKGTALRMIALKTTVYA